MIYFLCVFGGAVLGFIICALLTASKMNDR